MSHSHHAPSLPDVTDEAPNTPNWVPALGFGLFALIALMIAVRYAVNDSANAAAPAADAAPAAAAPTAPAAPSPAAEPSRQAIGAPAP